MTDNSGIRSGSLQFYPRVRAKKVIPSVNWKSISKGGIGFLGFIGYKVGMVSVWAKDDTPDSLTKNKEISIPATVIECPSMKIYSVRFYKNNEIVKEIVVTNDKDLKKKVKLSKEVKKLGEFSDFDEVRVLMYSNIKSTASGKKKPDIVEIGLSGSSEENLPFIKERIGKEISITEIFEGGLVDIRAVTKGYGTQGPVKRFGISLKSHKSEKGQRRPGSLGPWHPARVDFRTPQAGQTGYHNRITYNNLILEIGKIDEKDINRKGGFHHYGDIKNDYIILKGSIPGPKKRGVVITKTIRPSKYLVKKKYEVLGLR
jgi:large subunit ribosomal protein L3